MKYYIPKPGERVPAAALLVEPCEKLLDVGCGDGIIRNFVAGKVKTIYGVDNSHSELDKAVKSGLKVKLVDLDTQNLPFRSDYFCTVTCLDVIEHVRDPEALLSKIYRVIKKGGKLIVATPNIRFTNHIFELIFKGNFPKTSTDTNVYDGGHLHFFTYNDMKKLLSNTGFVIEKTEGIINKPKRGWKGQILEFLLGKKFMLEFRAQGILLVARK
jgi:methionine biosynthesis protein MetW